MSLLPAFGSSGDLLADRRYSYAKGALDEGDFPAAIDLARQALELAPQFAAAWALLGRALLSSGERTEAAEALTRALALDPDDPMGLRVDLAHLGALPAESAVTGSYVRALFDDYAPRFEKHLLKSLNYRGPELIADALRRASTRRLPGFRFRRVLDLGCGTGLMARALEGSAGTIEGVDLSGRMLAQARKTHLYDALHESDLVAFLQSCDAASADLVVAADVFVYMAALDAAFREAHRVLERGGFLAFTVQAHAGEGVVLGEDARYAHAEGYLRELAAATDFGVAIFEAVSTRQDRGEDVPGFVAVLER
jgi:predicted TPR repeat methyltransferase